MKQTTTAEFVQMLLFHAQGTDSPLDSLMEIVEATLDAARVRFCPTACTKLVWSEQEQVWLLNRVSALLERDIQLYPWKIFKVAVYLDRNDEDSEYLETREVRAPTADSAIAAILALSPFGIGCHAEEVP